MSKHSKKHPIVLSIGIMAWNEERSIRTTLESLFRQSIFERLSARHQQCEIVVVANACTDRTAQVTRELFEEMEAHHEWSDGFVTCVVDLPEAGKCNAWNRFVHEFSSVEAQYICLVDADIVFHNIDTIFNLMAALEREPHAHAASGRQVKDILFKPRKTLWDRISLATSDMSATGGNMICGQLYCVRAETVRKIYLPRSLGVEDGFIKETICTEFLTRRSDSRRIIFVPEAAHIFEAYVSPRAVMNNQKRQMIGQTTMHVLVEYLKGQPWQDRMNFAEMLRRHEARDPDWLKNLLAAHVRRCPFFWQLFPGILSFRFKRLLKLPGMRKLSHLPAACTGFAVTMIACARAHRALRKGVIHYWPKAERQADLSLPQTAK